MAEIVIRRAELGDADLLASAMRQSDIDELHACGHSDLHHVVRSSIERSVLCWSAFADGELCCILGASPLNMMLGIGSPWMLGTPVLDRHQRVLVRKTPEYIGRMLNAFPHLVNFVHAHNHTSVRWLRRLGFTLHEAQPYGALGEPFHLFEMKANHV